MVGFRATRPSGFRLLGFWATNASIQGQFWHVLTVFGASGSRFRVASLLLQEP